MDTLFVWEIFQPLCSWFLLFLFYSFLGWCCEMIYCSIGQRHLCEKRGFLNGFICPIYGHGALLVLWTLSRWNHNPVVTFVLGGLLTTVLEYVTSYVMEKLFHMRWWDYSHYRFQIHGRVCLLNTLLFGAACVILCHGIAPTVNLCLSRLMETGIAFPLSIVLGVIYIVDVVVSIRSAIRMRIRLEKLHALREELASKLETLYQEQQERLETQYREQQEKWEQKKERLEVSQQKRQEKSEQQKELLESKFAVTKEKATQKLEPIKNEFSLRMEQVRQDTRARLQKLCEEQDFFERRLMYSFPHMRSQTHNDALERLREFHAKRKKGEPTDKKP